MKRASAKAWQPAVGGPNACCRSHAGAHLHAGPSRSALAVAAPMRAPSATRAAAPTSARGPEAETGEPGVTYATGPVAWAVSISGGEVATALGPEWALTSGPMDPDIAAPEAAKRLPPRYYPAT